MTFYSLMALAGSVLDVICLVTVIFVERKNPASTIAWALVILFLPFVGFVAYAMFGSGFHIKKKKRYAAKRVTDSFHRRHIARTLHAREGAPSRPAIPYGRLVHYLEKDGEHYLTTNNAATLFTSGQALFCRMRKDLRAAKRHIHLLYYIFRNDALGRDILAILAEKARGGVDVRVIYDSLGSLLSGERLFRELRDAGGRVEAFSPLLFSLSSHLRLNYRNHRKIAVIDGLTGYVGGMNIGEEYLGKKKRLSPWRDTHLRLSGSSVTFLEERFLLDWTSVSDAPLRAEEMQSFMPPPLVRGNLDIQIVSSGPDGEASTLKNGLLELIYTARKNIFIQTPYFIPDDSVLDALRIAAGSGVDVRLMLPRASDNLLVHAATYSYARQVREYGVRVYAYDGFLHAKSLTVDHGAASIGTANLDCRSFSLNFEVSAFIYDSAFVSQCETVFLHDLGNCTALDEDWFRRRSLLTRAVYSVSRLFAPLM